MSEVVALKKTYVPYVLVAFISLFSLAFLDNSRGPFFQDIIVSLGLRDSRAAWFFMATSFMSFVLGRATPKILDFVSLLNLVRVGHLVMAMGFALVSFSNSLMSLVASAAVFGIGYGIVNVTENLLIVDGSSPQLRRQLLSGLHSIYAFSSLVAPLAISFLIEDGVTWRQAFFYFSAMPVLAFIATFSAKPLEAETAEVEIHEHKTPPGALLVSIGIGLYVMAELAVSTRLPLYLRRESATAADVASRFLAFFFFLLFLGRILFSLVRFSRLSNLQIMQGSLLLSAVVVTLGIFVSPAWLTISGFTMAPFFGVSLTYITESFGRDAKEALGAALALQSLFVVTMHFTLGWITEGWGIRVAMMAAPLCLLLGMLFIFIGSRKIHARVP